MYNEYWETDEFEDLVTRSIIGLHETKVKKNKRCPKSLRFDEQTFNNFKRVGCYFSPHDRIVSLEQDDAGKALFTQTVDLVNDGLPETAIYTTNPDNFMTDNTYLMSFFLQRLPSLPKPFASDIKGKYYRLLQIFFGNTHVSADGTIIVIDKEGRIQSCYIQDWYTDRITGRNIHFKNRPVIENNTGNQYDYFTVYSSVCIQIFQDRRYLWNVCAHDGIAKATFGVYPEQIKSLFYARDLPQTDSGRKRPILHWVQSHQRRMKSGTEVDVEQYLRGTHEFVMNGTKFKITNPMKDLT